MQSKSFSYKNLITIFVTLMLLISLTFTFSTAKADSVIKDYSTGGYVESVYGQTILLKMPDGTKGQDRSYWKLKTVQSGDKLGGWYRIENVYSYSEIMFFNVYVDINGEKLLNTIGYIGKYHKIMFSGFGVECELTKIEGVNCIEFFIPYDLSVNFVSGGANKTLTLQDYSTIILYSGIKAYKLIDENVSEDKTTLENLKIGSIDTLDRSNYITSNKDTYSLANRWFRFKKPSNTTRRTFDIANVSTLLDGNDYNVKLYYVEDDNGNESLWLGRFNVTYREVVINNETYIEFSIPKCSITYYNTEEAIITHTLKVGIMDTIKPIDDTLVGIEYNFVKSVQEDFATNSPYSSIMAGLGGVALLSVIFLITILSRENKQKKE